jgi:solute carrier family 25 (mitochondrial citrate transporter), member 1
MDYKKITSQGIAGFNEIFLTFPLENLKTRQQLIENKNLSLSKIFYNTIKNESPIGLYRGMSINAISNIPRSIFRFSLFEYSKNNYQIISQFYTNLIAGLNVGIWESIFFSIPVETIRTKLIHNPNLQIKVLLKDEGIFGIYRGCSSTILRQSLNQGIRFSAYNYFINNDKQMSEQKKFLYGCGAGFISTIITQPIDVIKTRQQQLKFERKTMREIFGELSQNPKIFYKGFWLRATRLSLAQGILFYTYDVCEKIMK